MHRFSIKKSIFRWWYMILFHWKISNKIRCWSWIIISAKKVWNIGKSKLPFTVLSKLACQKHLQGSSIKPKHTNWNQTDVKNKIDKLVKTKTKCERQLNYQQPISRIKTKVIIALIGYFDCLCGFHHQGTARTLTWFHFFPIRLKFLPFSESSMGCILTDIGKSMRWIVNARKTCSIFCK